MADETTPLNDGTPPGTPDAQAPVSEAELDKLFNQIANPDASTETALDTPESGGGQGGGDGGAGDGAVDGADKGGAAPRSSDAPAGQQGSEAAPAAGAPKAGDGAAPADKPAAAAPEGQAKPAPKAAAADKAAPAKTGIESPEEKIRRLEAADASNKGRLAALLRENQTLRNGNSTPHASPAPASSTGADKQGKDGTPAKRPAVIESLTSNPEWKKVATDYPEIAGPIEQALSELGARQELTDADRQKAILLANGSIVDKAHPDAGKIVRTPEFNTWVATQPSYVQSVLVRNAKGIVSPDDCIDIFARYKADTGFTPQAKPGAANDGQRLPVNNADRAADAARDLRRDSALVVKDGGKSVTSAPPEDPDQLFDFVVAQMDKQRKGPRAA